MYTIISLLEYSYHELRTVCPSEALSIWQLQLIIYYDSIIMRWLFLASASIVVQTDNNTSYRTQITIPSFSAPLHLVPTK